MNQPPYLTDIYIVVCIHKSGNDDCFRMGLCILRRLGINLENMDQPVEPCSMHMMAGWLETTTTKMPF